MEIANWITALSTLVMAIATIVMAVAAWQAKNSFIKEKLFDSLFDLNLEISKAKKYIWQYFVAPDKNLESYIKNTEKVIDNVNSLTHRIYPFLSLKRKQELHREVSSIQQLFLIIIQGGNREIQLEVIKKIINVSNLQDFYNFIEKAVKEVK